MAAESIIGRHAAASHPSLTRTSSSVNRRTAAVVSCAPRLVSTSTGPFLDPAASGSGFCATMPGRLPSSRYQETAPSCSDSCASDDDDVPLETGGARGRQSIERLAEQGRAIVGADEDGRIEPRHDLLTPCSCAETIGSRRPCMRGPCVTIFTSISSFGAGRILPSGSARTRPRAEVREGACPQPDQCGRGYSATMPK